jgi:Protein of unknown function (DUF2971)
MHEGYMAALDIVDKIIQLHGLDDKRPPLLHHYTSLDAALSIIQQRDIWLCHCEYLNDGSEISRAASLIKERIAYVQQHSINSRMQQQFYADVNTGFVSQSQLYEAFVFSMSEGKSGINGQDILSAWRAYGNHGRGVFISFESQHFIIFSKGAIGFRLSRVIYDDRLQEQIVDELLNEGYKLYCAMSDPKEAIKCMVAALMFLMPIMKHPDFGEEKEWRLIYLPKDEDPSASKRKFFVRDDIIVPYYSMQDTSGDKVSTTPPIAEIMVGPSTHQALNLRTMEFLRARAVVKGSSIPYRT